jgi:hypothetical protein
MALLASFLAPDPASVLSLFPPLELLRHCHAFHLPFGQFVGIGLDTEKEKKIFFNVALHYQLRRGI